MSDVSWKGRSIEELQENVAVPSELKAQFQPLFRIQPALLPVRKVLTRVPLLDRSDVVSCTSLSSSREAVSFEVGMSL